jgi:hypothetical protein
LLKATSGSAAITFFGPAFRHDSACLVGVQIAESGGRATRGARLEESAALGVGRGSGHWVSLRPVLAPGVTSGHMLRWLLPQLGDQAAASRWG